MAKGSSAKRNGAGRAKASVGLIDPNEGPWALNWCLTDRTGPFPWPETKTSAYSQLAGTLASMNELSLDTFFAQERMNGRSGVHILQDHDLSDAALQQWQDLYSRYRLDSGDWPELSIATISYCRGYGDPRRIIAVFAATERALFPLWWDPRHQVSGSTREPTTNPCPGTECHHSPDAPA